jgi:hypothetical protein
MSDIFITGIEEKYPKELLENRYMYEGNVIGIIYKDILVLDEVDFKSDDFITQDGRFYFEIANNIRKKGFNVIDDCTIFSECGEVVTNGYEKRGGWQEIQNIIDVVNDKNSETIFDILDRENIILKLHRLGIDLLKPVDCDGKEVIPIKLFRKMDSESIVEWYENKINEVSMNGSNKGTKVLEEGDLEITDDFLQGLEDGLESGIPFDMCGQDIDGEDIKCLPYTSNEIGGLMDETFNMLGGFSSSGKTTAWTTILMGLQYRGKKITIISNEQRSAVFKMQFLMWILVKYLKYFKLTKKKLKNKNEMTQEDREMIKKAQKVWNEKFKDSFKFVQIADADMSIVKKKIRKYALSDGFDTFLYDTFKCELDDGIGENNHLKLIKDSRTLDKLCKKYKLLGLASIQLAEGMNGTLFLNASVLSQSKQIKEVLESLTLMRPTFSEEIDPDNKKFYCKPFRRKLINNKWVHEDYTPDKDAVYRTVFFTKTRNGVSSDDTGIAMLWKFNGAMGVFTESAFCYPKHGKIS